MSGLALGLTSLAVGVASTGASFGQAGAQRRKREGDDHRPGFRLAQTILWGDGVRISLSSALA